MKLNKFSIIICTYSIFPEDRSSEGIVNNNWYEILNEEQISCGLLSSSVRTKIITKDSDSSFVLCKNLGLAVLFRFYKAQKKSFKGAFFRLANSFFLAAKITSERIHLNEYIWLKSQKKDFKFLVENYSNYVVWLRILPSFPIALVLEQWGRTNFPFIININDTPEGFFENEISIEENLLIQTRDKAQCWTFPCKSLAITISQKYQLDIDRCFVIPHAMKEQKALYHRKVKESKRLKFIYAGTFYKSAFTDEFGAELKSAFLSGEINHVDFVFILSQFNEESIQWIQSNVPSAKIYKKISREKVLKITSEADCMLVVDSIKHTDLLKGKLIEAISQGLPIFAVTYENSVMDKVVQEYGGISSYQDQPNDISSKLLSLSVSLNYENWLEKFYIERESVLAKISHKQIAMTTSEIAQYAYNRFLFAQGKSNYEPEPPLCFDWP